MATARSDSAGQRVLAVGVLALVPLAALAACSPLRVEAVSAPGDTSPGADAARVGPPDVAFAAPDVPPSTSAAADGPTDLGPPVLVDAMPLDGTTSHTDATTPDVAPTPIDQPDPALVGRWPFDEGAGSVAMDTSGNANHGGLRTPDPAFAWGPGRRGGALNLTASTWVEVPTSTSINSVAATNAVTVTAWVFARSIGPDAFNFIVSRQLGLGPLDNFGLTLREGRPTFAIVTDFVSGPTPIGLRRWLHLAVTYDGQAAYVYADGVQVATRTLGRRITTETRPLLIGGNQNDGSSRPKEFFDGFVDDVAVWSRALGPAEIAALAR
jgi:hypothetical protein